MKYGDVLIAKDTELPGISKYDKVVITYMYSDNTNFYYKIECDVDTMILHEKDIPYYFWTLSEYRKLIIKDLI